MERPRSSITLERVQVDGTKKFKFVKKKSEKEKSWRVESFYKWRGPQSRKMNSWGNYVKKSGKNNFTDFGFEPFFAIYKRGNQNW